MARISNAETRVAYIAEVTENVTPATPAFQVFRATGESLNVDRTITFSSELDGRRGQKNHAVSAEAGSGSIDFELSDGMLEDMLESVLRSAWNADVLVDGNTPKSFTFEATYEGGATDIYKRLTGAQVNTLTLNLQASLPITGTLALMARGADFSNAEIADSSYTPGGTEPIEVGATVGGVTLAGLTLDCVNSLALTINNNLAGEYCLGSHGPTNLAPGQLEVTATMRAFVSSAQYDILRAYADGTATGLDFEVGETEGAKLAFSIPTAIIETLTLLSQNADGSAAIDFTLRALQDTDLSGSVIEIERHV